MKTITHREMRNNSGEILRRVEAGETIQVTNRGRVVATIGPPAESVLEELIRRGQAQPATKPLSSLRQIKRVKSERSTAEIIADARGRW